MSQELLYTSAPRGLKPGSRGFCTVLSTQGMPAPLATAVEALSGYRPVYPASDERAARNPVVYSHLKMQAAGRSWHVLSRIADYGLDYSQRSNKLAHHVILDKQSERLPGGPANLLSMPGFMREEWEGEPKLVVLKPITREPRGPTGICQRWKEVTGDAGWAGVIAESFLRDPERLVILLFEPGQEVLPLYAEVLSLLPPEKRWDATFSTYFTSLATGTTCNWRAILHDSKEAHESLRFVNALRIDLTKESLAPADLNGLVDAARSGLISNLSETRTAQSPGDFNDDEETLTDSRSQNKRQIPPLLALRTSLPPSVPRVRDSHTGISIVSSNYNSTQHKHSDRRRKRALLFSFIVCSTLIGSIWYFISQQYTMPPQESRSETAVIEKTHDAAQEQIHVSSDQFVRRSSPTVLSSQQSPETKQTLESMTVISNEHLDRTNTDAVLTKSNRDELTPEMPNVQPHSVLTQDGTAKGADIIGDASADRITPQRLIPKVISVPINPATGWIELCQIKTRPSDGTPQVHLVQPKGFCFSTEPVDKQQLGEYNDGINIIEIVTAQEQTSRSAATLAWHWNKTNDALTYYLKQADTDSKKSLFWCGVHILPTNETPHLIYLTKFPVAITRNDCVMKNNGVSGVNWPLCQNVAFHNWPKLQFTHLSLHIDDKSYSIAPLTIPRVKDTKVDCVEFLDAARNICGITNTVPSSGARPTLNIVLKDDSISINLLNAKATLERVEGEWIKVTEPKISPLKADLEKAINILTKPPEEIQKDTIFLKAFKLNKSTSEKMSELESICTRLRSSLNEALSQSTDPNKKEPLNKLIRSLDEKSIIFQQRRRFNSFCDACKQNISITSAKLEYAVGDSGPDSAEQWQVTVIEFDITEKRKDNEAGNQDK